MFLSLLPCGCPSLSTDYFPFPPLYRVLHNALLLSDSRLHLFLQSHLNAEDIEACVSGQTKYSVEEAIHKFALTNRRFPEENEEGKKENDIDYDSERYFLAFPWIVCVLLPHVAHPRLCADSSTHFPFLLMLY